MLTSSEVVVTATIWALTAVGGFFGFRAALRRRKGHATKKKKGAANLQHE